MSVNTQIFSNISNMFQQQVAPDMMKKMADATVNYYLQSFQTGRFVDTNEKWENKKDGDPSFLKESGDLERAVANSLKSFDANGFYLEVDVEKENTRPRGDYGVVHNDGLKGITRQFFPKEGDTISYKLEQILINIGLNEMDRLNGEGGGIWVQSPHTTPSGQPSKASSSKTTGHTTGKVSGGLNSKVGGIIGYGMGKSKPMGNIVGGTYSHI